MFHIFGFYKFCSIKKLNTLKNYFQRSFINSNIRGTLILSKEGLNGTLSENQQNLIKVKKNIKYIFKIKNLILKFFPKVNFNLFKKQK